MASPAMPSTATKVFAIPELLEQILLRAESDMYALFRLQRVSHAFKDVIVGTPSLRRIMLLEYATEVESVEVNTVVLEGGDMRAKWKPLYRMNLEWKPRSRQEVEEEELWARYPSLYGNPRYPPNDKYYVTMSYSVQQPDSDDCVSVTTCRLDMGLLLMQLPLMESQTASWRAIKVLNRALPFRVCSAGYHGTIKRSLAKDVTLGILLDCVKADMGQDPVKENVKPTAEQREEVDGSPQRYLEGKEHQKRAQERGSSDSMDSTAFTPAAAKVFNIPELLENILLHLGVKDLFAVQIVNLMISGVMAGSEKLQRAMFLIHGTNLPATTSNPLLAEHSGVALSQFDHIGFKIHRQRVSQGWLWLEIHLDSYLGPQSSELTQASKRVSWRRTKLTAGPASGYCSLRAKRLALWDLDTLGDVSDWLADMVTLYSEA
ncbi:hypothetical protein LTR85_003111 [Meristemomyces frigidus]|nr:hypothetical protein LTR85_003111 [Meristemomyces frigidus]